MEVVALSVLFSVAIGLPLGLVSGFVGGGVDRVLVFLMDAMYAFPSLLLAIVFSFLLSGLLGGGIMAAALSLTAIYIPQYFRVVRNTTVSPGSRPTSRRPGRWVPRTGRSWGATCSAT